MSTTRSNEHQLVYRVGNVVRMLDVSRATVYRLAKDGRLKLVKIGTSASGITAQSLGEYMRSIGA